MKRTILIITVIVLSVCMMAGCSRTKSDAPSSEEVKQIIPAKAHIDLSDYPMLTENIPDPQDIFAKIPQEYQTFTFVPENWKLGNHNEYEQYYTSLSDSNLRLYVYEGTYTLTYAYDETEFIEVFACSYDAEGSLTGYNNYQNGIYYSTDNDGFAFLSLPIDQATYWYQFSDGVLQCVEVTVGRDTLLSSLGDELYPEKYSGFSFLYYPQENRTEGVSYEYYTQYSDGKYNSYSAFYTESGELESIRYHDAYSENKVFSCIYDKNYQLAECYISNTEEGSTKNLYSSAKQ